MHPIVLYIAAVWIVVLFGVNVILIIRMPSALARILVFDTMSLILVAFLGLSAAASQSAYYLDAALLLALFAFSGTLAAARYHKEGKIFS